MATTGASSGTATGASGGGATEPPRGGFLVFGATGGTGQALCAQLGAAGFPVTAAGRDPEKLAALAAELGCATVRVDLGEPATIRTAFTEAAERHDGLRGAANLIGTVLLKPAHMIRDAEWDETILVNLTSSFWIIREAARTMKQGGAVALVASAAARSGIPNHEAIAAAKGGIIGLTLSAAATYAPTHLRFNCVAPGLVQTPLTQRIWGHEKSRAVSKAMHPLGRLGQPEDVARALFWLLDPAQSWVTGQVLGVDGGLATLRPRA